MTSMVPIHLPNYLYVHTYVFLEAADILCKVAACCEMRMLLSALLTLFCESKTEITAGWRKICHE